MKKHQLFLFATLLPLLASAQTKVEIDGIWYNLVSKGKVAEVTYKGNTPWEYDEYTYSITIPSMVTYEGIDYSVTSIGNEAFYFCSSLTDINIPESVRSIGGAAFRECSNLTTINIPEGVTSIEQSAFCYCSNLTAITIPKGVMSIGESAFIGCSSLTAITVDERNTVYDSRSECNAIIETNSNTLIFGCSATIIPKGVMRIGDNAFSGSSNLTTITIPEGVTSIGDGTFWGCSRLTAIMLPKSIENISSLALANCGELLDVYCYAEEMPETRSDAFNDSYPEYATLHVPASALDTYKRTAPWRNFGTIVVLEDEGPLEKCATPVISYVGGEVVFACETEGAVIKSEVHENVSGKFEGTRIAIIPTYTITAYATKEKYEDSDIATITLYWIPCKEEHKEDNGILTIPAKPVLISTQGGAITVNGLAASTEVSVYDATGRELATATATDGTATLNTNLTQGDIAIVKVGDYGVKVVIK